MKELFPAGRPVRGNLLIGRDNLLEELANILSIGQSVVLVAPRRYGKTSIALEILKRFKAESYFIADIDIFDITDKRHLSEKIIESCLKNNPVSVDRYWKKLKDGTLSVLSMLKFKPSNDELDLVFQLEKPTANTDKLLDDALDFPENFCKRHKKKMLVFIDEFQDVLKIGGDALLKKMRSKFQRHENVIYVFAGSQETLMTTLFQQRQHAFYRFARLFEVGNIDNADFTKYISRSFSSEKIKIEPKYINDILKISGGHPYYTQLLCQMIYINCLKSKTIIIDNKDITLAESGVIDHETPLFDEIWKELGNKKFSRNIAVLIAQGLSPYLYKETSKENIARILADLTTYGYLSKEGAGKSAKYHIKDEFFKKYIYSKTEAGTMQL